MTSPVLTDSEWLALAEADAADDRSAVVHDGVPPEQLCCDTTVRPLPDGTWVTIQLGLGHTEPLPANRVCMSRSLDEGRTWSPMSPIDLGVKSREPDTALCPSELQVHNGRAMMVVSTHNGGFGEWRTFFTYSADSCRTWSPLSPAPGRLAERTFIRNTLVTRDGRLLMPFQHYLKCDAAAARISNGRFFHRPHNPRNGVIISADAGQTWSEHGDIRLTADDNYHGWAESNVVELSDGRIAMMIRGDGLGGMLWSAESRDGGRSWPALATRTGVPNPGSKATLYGLGGDTVAMLHNPNPKHRSPLALWISFDGMQTWPYRRVLVAESCDAGGNLNYPDGFVSADGRYLNFAFDDNRHRCVFYAARLPELSSAVCCSQAR